MTTLLHRFTVRPGHLDAYLDVWNEEARLRARHGFRTHRAFVETDAEPKLTWLYSHADLEAGNRALGLDPETTRLAARRAPLVFGNTVVRPVEVEVMTEHADPTRLAIMRRYSIVGEWEEFLSIWRRIVPVRERYGFTCLFAVADREKDMFTWAFGFDGAWEDFPAAQRPYYHDPERVELRRVFDFMADYTIHPARQLTPPV